MTRVELVEGQPVIRVPEKVRINLGYHDGKDMLMVGDKANLSKTVTNEDISRFAQITGDTNPLHLDETFSGNARFGKRIAHGMLTGGLISAVIGTRLPGPGTIYINQSMAFKKPVYIGDTITAVVEITKIHKKAPIVTLSTICYNQNQEVVVMGTAVVLVDYVDIHIS